MKPCRLEWDRGERHSDGSATVAVVLQEAESKPQCRRLQLKDIIPIEMQRLTKYPLLLENIAKNTGASTTPGAPATGKHAFSVGVGCGLPYVHA